MYDIINEILEGNFDYENGSLDFSCAKIELTLPKECIYEGSFHITSTPGRLTNGYVVTSDLRMECLTPDFSGSDAEIAYCFHGEHTEEGDVIKGTFSVISNQGEYYLPFVVSIEHTILQSSIGSIKNLFHFANLAKSNWQEAVNLFYSPDFIRIFAGTDAGYLDCYRGLSACPGNEQNVEEFLIHVNKKHKVEFLTAEQNLTISLTTADSPYAVTECEVDIVRNGWGYTALNVECEGDFVFTEKEFLTDDDFLGNLCRLPVFIDSSRCRRGRNFGQIFLFNSYVSLTIPVEVRVGDSTLSGRPEGVKKRAVSQLMEFYQDFRLKKINTHTWLKETGKLVERLVTLDEKDVAARLFQAQLLITEERFHEAGWILDHAADLMDEEEEEDEVLRAYYLYLTTLIHREEAYVREAASMVEQLYRRRRNEWRIAWLLLYLSEEYNRTAAGKWMFLEKQFDHGCTSPVIYIEALTLLNNNPPLMRKLEDFELQVLYYGARQESLSDEAVEQLLYLCEKKRDYSQILLNTLKKLYPKKKDVRILREICALLIKGGKAGQKYFTWYQKGVQEQLRITNLYEHYMMSLDLNVMQPIPKIVLMYFSYQNNLDYEHSAYLYHYLIQNKEEFAELYEHYGARMEHFVVDQIQKEHINRHLAVLYQVMLTPGMIKEQTAGPLSRILFANWIRVEDRRLRKVFVYQPGHNWPEEYILQDNSTWVSLYGSEYTIVFEDAYGNRFSKSVDYTLEKLMLPGKYPYLIAPYVKDSFSFNLYLCESDRAALQLNPESVERFLLAAGSEEASEEIRREFSLKILQYYYDMDDMRALDQYLLTMADRQLTMDERGIVVKYMVFRGKYKEAYEWMEEYGPYFIEPRILVRLLDELTGPGGSGRDSMSGQKGIFGKINMSGRRGMFVQEEILLAAALETFRRGKYDSSVLQYLSQYFQGMTKDMRDIWKAAKSFDVDCYELCEKMLVQMLYSGAFVGEKLEIFRYYVSQGAKQEVEEAFLSQCAYDYFVREKVTDSCIFHEIQNMYQRKEEVQKICKLAFLKYYAENKNERDKGKNPLIEAFLKEMLAEKIHLEFFREYKEFASLLGEMTDKTIIEYRTQPGARARIHYVTVHDNGEAGEYRSEYMRVAYGGVCFKEFVLFFGESLQYYIMEENDGEDQLTESGSLQRNDIENETENSKFGLINDIVISKTLQDYDTLDNLLEEYFRREYLNSELFRLQ